MPDSVSGLDLTPPCTLQINVSPYSMEDVHRARHQHDLQQGAALHLHLDHQHMGVGGDDSWSPSVHAEFLVPPAPYRFSVALAPALPAHSATGLWKALGLERSS
jgi:beta-galactosidase